jgi:hypothetical protein
MKFQPLSPALLIMFCAADLFGQTPLPGLRVEPATGSSILFVHDAATQPPLTAFLVELVHYPGSYYQLWADDVTAQPIAPDAEKRIVISNMTVGAVPNYVKVTAAIYADGTTSGVAEKVAQLIARRKFLLQTTRELIGRLDKAHATASDLKQWADSLPALTKSTQNSQDAINQSAAKSLISDTVTQLSTHSVEETLASLRLAEAALVASKPLL